MSSNSAAPYSEHSDTGHQLEQAFAEFNRVSAELGDAWGDLESRVARLTSELAAARSERLRELAAKEALADKLSALMEAMPAGVILLERGDKVGAVNATARDMLGGTLTGRPWATVLDDIGSQDGCEGEFDTTDGRRFALVYSALGDSDRIALLTDISDAHRMRQKMQREQRLGELGDMAARLAHQLRTPLSSAMLYLSRLDGSLPSDAVQVISARAQERLRQIERQIDGMLRFIRGNEEPVTEVCLASLARETAAALSPLLERSGAQLSIHCPADVPVILGQREILLNAMGNLLDNALNSCGSNPEIRLAVEVVTEAVCVSVTDNGPGVDPDIAEHIFESWFSTRANGTGLGLAVVASATEAHGGQIELSRPDDGGSRFTMIFPITIAEESR